MLPMDIKSEKRGNHRVACPKFGHPALSSEFKNYALNTGCIAAVDMLRKKNTIRKLKQFQN